MMQPSYILSLFACYAKTSKIIRDIMNLNIPIIVIMVRGDIKSAYHKLNKYTCYMAVDKSANSKILLQNF